MSRSSSPSGFALSSRLFHWGMGVLILIMLALGLYIAHSSTPYYPTLLHLHLVTGVSLLILVALRLMNRFVVKTPELPTDISAPLRLGAIGSHVALYGLMIAQPLVGWAMLSAGGYPITIGMNLTLPPLIPHNPALWAELRQLHSVLAYAFIAVIVLHIAAALFHGLIRRDHVLSSMVSGK